MRQAKGEKETAMADAEAAAWAALYEAAHPRPQCESNDEEDEETDDGA